VAVCVLKQLAAEHPQHYGQLKQREEPLLCFTHFSSDPEKSEKEKIKSDHFSSKESLSASSDWPPSQLLMKKDAFLPFPSDVHS
jgi:hypothetical protein